MGYTKEQRLINEINGHNKHEVRTPVGTGIFIPNNSGDHMRSIKRNEPVNDIDLVNKTYVDSSISTANLWSRTGTILSPKTAGDSISTTSSVTAGTNLYVGNGTSSAPSMTFTSDTDTGFYRPADGSISLVSNGNIRLRWVDSAGLYLGATGFFPRLLLNDGSTTPNINPRSGDDNTGIGSSNSDELTFWAGGKRATLTTTGLGINTTAPTKKLHIVETANIDAEMLIENSAYSRLAVASFKNPTNEWNMGVNDYGHYRFRDVSNGANVFTIEEGALLNSLYFKASSTIPFVGIGTTNPSYPLHIYSAYNTDLEQNIESTGAKVCQFGMKNSVREWKFGQNESGNFRIRDTTASANVFTIEGGQSVNRIYLKDDKVGIATATPAETLDVNGTIKGTDYKSSDGSAGITQTMTLLDADGVTTRTLTFKNGLLTAYS